MVMRLRVKPAMTRLFWLLHCCGLIYLLTRNDNAFLVPALVIGLEVCWSYSNEYHPCGYGIAGQARNNGKGGNDNTFLQEWCLSFSKLGIRLSSNTIAGQARNDETFWVPCIVAQFHLSTFLAMTARVGLAGHNPILRSCF